MTAHRRAAATVALFLVLLAARPAGAEGPAAVGYWWRLQGGVAPALTPPSVPDGGLWVAADPSGAHAVSAVRAPASGERVTSIALKIAEATGTVAVRACATTPAWEPAEAGAWESRPTADCERMSVEGVPSEDGSTLTFTIPESAGAAMRDFVFEPLPDASSFSATFESLGGDAITVLPARSTSTPSGDRAPAVSGPSFDPQPFSTPPADYAAPITGFSAPIYEDAPATGLPSVVEDAVDAASETGGEAAAAAPVPKGARQPMALLAVALLAAGWYWRTRVAVRGAADHPLARRQLLPAGETGADA